jgi:hypothetical protein
MKSDQRVLHHIRMFILKHNKKLLHSFSCTIVVLCFMIITYIVLLSLLCNMHFVLVLQVPSDLNDMLVRVFREGLEGLVLKDVNVSMNYLDPHVFLMLGGSARNQWCEGQFSCYM